MKGFMRQRGDGWDLRVYLGRDPVTGRQRYASRTVRSGKRAGLTPIHPHLTPGQLVALRWSDVDLAVGVVRVERGVVNGPDGLVEKDTKTRAARRVALDNRTVDIVRSHRERMAERAALRLCCPYGLASTETAWRSPTRATTG